MSIQLVCSRLYRESLPSRGKAFILLLTTSPSPGIDQVLDLPVAIEPYQLERIHPAMAEFPVEIEFIGRPYNGKRSIYPYHIKTDALICGIFCLLTDKINEPGNFIGLHLRFTLFVSCNGLKNGAVGKDRLQQSGIRILHGSKKIVDHRLNRVFCRLGRYSKRLV